MKIIKTLILIAVFMSLAAGVLLATFKYSDRVLNQQKSGTPEVQRDVNCTGRQSQDHQVVLKEDKAIPEHIDAPLCDTLTITNQDENVKYMAFGEHDKHQAYDGVTEKVLVKGESLKVTLVERGGFIFHDHIGDKSQGSFTVR